MITDYGRIGRDEALEMQTKALTHYEGSQVKREAGNDVRTSTTPRRTGADAGVVGVSATGFHERA